MSCHSHDKLDKHWTAYTFITASFYFQLINIEFLVELTFDKTGNSNAKMETKVRPEEPYLVVHYLTLNIQLN